MKFKNVENEHLVVDGRDIWLSRSVAVVATVCVLFRGDLYILINKRGKGTPDFQGYWNLPCGYLDYNETTGEAAIREVWEECGVNVTILDSLNVFDHMEKPWDVNSNPDKNRQNISFVHGMLAHVDNLPTTSLENNEPDEVEEVRWVKLKDYKNKEYNYAFNHDVRIEKFINKLPNNLIKNM